MAFARTPIVKHSGWDAQRDMAHEGCVEAVARQRRCSDFDDLLGSCAASSKTTLDDDRCVSTTPPSEDARSLDGSSWDEAPCAANALKSEPPPPRSSLHDLLELFPIGEAPGASSAPEMAPSPTTLMLRNLPRHCTRSRLQCLLDREGFACRYIFIYAPVDWQTLATSGFAFVGFCDHDAAAQAKRHFQGFSRWDVPGCRKRCNAAWSGVVQGLEQHIERYRNSSVMHPLVPDELKPAIFVAGIRMPFPAPTREIPAPDLHGNVPSYATAHRGRMS